MRPIDGYLVRILHADTKAGTVVTIHGPTFFLARARAAVRFKVDPADIRPAIRITMAKADGVRP